MKDLATIQRTGKGYLILAIGILLFLAAIVGQAAEPKAPEAQAAKNSSDSIAGCALTWCGHRSAH